MLFGPVPHEFNPQAKLLATPHVQVTQNVYRRLVAYTNLCTTEIGFWCAVERPETLTFLVYEMFLIGQTVTPRTVNLNKDARMALLEALLADGEKGEKIAGDLRCWVHSHVAMSVDPSHDDREQIIEFHKQGLPWLVAGILNKCGRMRFDVYDFTNRFYVTDVPWSVTESPLSEADQALLAEIQEKVAVEAPIVHSYTPPMGGTFVGPGFVSPLQQHPVHRGSQSRGPTRRHPPAGNQGAGSDDLPVD